MAFSFGNTPATSAPATGGFSFGTTTPAPTPTTTTATGLFGAPAPAPSTSSTGGLFGSTFSSTTSGGLFGSSAPAPSATTATPSSNLFGFNSASSQPLNPQQQFQQQQQQQQQLPVSSDTPYSQLPPHLKSAIDEIHQLLLTHRRTIYSIKSMTPSPLVQPDGDAAAGTNYPASSQFLPSSSSSSSSSSLQLREIKRLIDDISKSTSANLEKCKEVKQISQKSLSMTQMYGCWPVEITAVRRGVTLTSLRRLLDSASQDVTTGGATPTTNASASLNLESMTLQHVMDQRAASVDRTEMMPSPYFWEMLHALEQRKQDISFQLDDMTCKLGNMQELDRSLEWNDESLESCIPSLALCRYEEEAAAGGGRRVSSLPSRLATLARIQNDRFLRIASQVSKNREELEIMKSRYRRMWERNASAAGMGGGGYDDPFFRADVEEMRKEREVQQKIIEQRMIASASSGAVAGTNTGTSTPSSGGLFGGGTPAPSGGLFGSTPAAPAPSGGLFGSAAPAPSGGLFGSTPAAPAPSTGGLFGSTPAAPAPSTGGLFGSTSAAPAPSTGGLFGSTPSGPAPSTGGLFGSTPAPASGGLFGTPAPAPAGGLFGSTPAPSAAAPATGGLFGAPAPAPAAGGLFGSTPAPAAGTGLFAAPTTPASTLAPRKKPGSRSGGRRR